MIDWLKRNRNLRVHFIEKAFEKKREHILRLFSIAKEGYEYDVEPYVIDSHQALIRHLASKNIIICDVHFFDIAMLVASSYYSRSTYDVEKLSDALLVDSLVCSDDLSVACEYAHRFISGPYCAVFAMIAHKDLQQRILCSRELQMLFAFFHEFAHIEYDKGKTTLIKFMEEPIQKCIEEHNSYMRFLSNMLSQPLAGVLNETQMLEDCVCDMLALLNLLDFHIQGVERIENIKMVLEAYLLCLSSQDFVYNTMNVQNYCNGKGYGYVDYIHMRLEIERELIKDTLRLYATIHDEELTEDDIQGINEYFQNAIMDVDKMYSVYSEYVFSIDFSMIHERYIPFGTKEWKACYMEIQRLFQFPV